MKGEDKTKEQLIDELVELRQRIAELEASETERQQAEEEIRLLKEKYEDLYNNAPTMYLSLDTNGILIECNNTILHRLGYTKREFIGKHMAEFVTEETAANFRKDFPKLLETGEILGVERQLVTKSGDILDVLLDVTMEYDEHRKPIKTRATFEDITTRKRAEEGLLLKTTLLEAQSEASIDGILVVGSEGNAVSFNERMREMWNIPQEIWDTRDDEKMRQYAVTQLKNPDEFREKVRYLYAHKEEKSRDEIELKDGRHFDRYSSPLVDSNGRYHGRIWYFRDITERKRMEEALQKAHDELERRVEERTAELTRTNEELQIEITEHKKTEEALRKSEEKYSTLVEQGNDGIIIIQDALMKFANQKMVEMTGFALEEAVGKSFVDFVAPECRELVVDRYKKRTSGEKVPNNYEIEILAKDGRKIPVEINASMIEYEGKFADMAIIRDITERKQIEEKVREAEALKELDQLRTELLANISHELRTPLASIKGFATTLLQPDVKWSEEEQQDFLEIIDQETDRLTRIINDLLDMSRLEARALKLEKGNYQISEILDAVSSRLASLTEHHRLEMIVPAELPSVFVDEMRIGQVLTNLVENATKYSRESSPITIEAQLAGDQIIVSVTDRGQGIPSDLLDKVFDRFYQTESIVTGQKSGTGLGLSICRGILAAHGGEIWVESKVGQGSKFSFSLPLNKREEEVA